MLKRLFSPLVVLAFRQPNIRLWFRRFASVLIGFFHFGNLRHLVGLLFYVSINWLWGFIGALFLIVFMPAKVQRKRHSISQSTQQQKDFLNKQALLYVKK